MRSFWGIDSDKTDVEPASVIDKVDCVSVNDSDALVLPGKRKTWEEQNKNDQY
jgi:hypothetical protein